MVMSCWNYYRTTIEVQVGSSFVFSQVCWQSLKFSVIDTKVGAVDIVVDYLRMHIDCRNYPKEGPTLACLPIFYAFGWSVSKYAKQIHGNRNEDSKA